MGTIDWGEYRGFEPGVDRPLHEVTRTQAKTYFERFMAVRQERIKTLRMLAAHNGVELTDDDDGLCSLNRWYVEHVDGDAASIRLDAQWYVVTRDIGIWLGEHMIARAPDLEWRLFTGGASDVAYQRPVVMGFKVRNAKYNVDPELSVAGLGERVLQGERDDSFFERVVHFALERA